MTFDQVREELVKMLKISRAGEKSVDMETQAFNSARATGLEDAIELIDKVLEGELAAYAKGASQGREGERRRGERRKGERRKKDEGRREWQA